MPTEKLYWTDPFATTFETRGARLGALGDRPSVVLDRTLFYPEAGGQLADVGDISLADAGGACAPLRVLDVQIDDAGDIHHFVLGKVPPLSEDTIVRGVVDSAHRRDMMAQHTAQHALSRALVDVASAETVSARLGSAACTIDVTVSDIADSVLAKAEDLVNAVVTSDVVVRSLFPSAEELAQMPLRRAPKVTHNVRVIEIEGFDLSPCGGTHCTRSGQIGQVRVVGTERYKGKMRVTFHAGGRALADARTKDAVLSALAKDFTCGPLDVPNAVGKLKKDLESARSILGATRGELLELLSERILNEHAIDPSGSTVIVVTRPKDDLSMLRALAGRLTQRPDVVAICAARDEAMGDLAVVVQRGSSASFDCGKWLKSKALATGGRGGGKSDRAEGRLPSEASLP
jgi:alanyl-tRNA synthetase